MTGRHWLVAIFSIVVLPFLVGLAFLAGINAQMSDTRWLNPSELNEPASAQQAELPASTPSVGDDFSEASLPEETSIDASAPGDNLRADTIREQVAKQLDFAVWICVAATIMIGALWIVFVTVRLPSVVGTTSARSLRVQWLALTLAVVISVALIAIATTGNEEVRPYLIVTGRLQFIVGLAGCMLIAWWLGSLFATPHRLRPSVPGGNSVPIGVE